MSWDLLLALHAIPATPAMRATSTSPWRGSSPRLAAVPGEYLVKFRPTGQQPYAISVLRAAAFNVKRSFSSVPGLHHVVAAAGA